MIDKSIQVAASRCRPRISARRAALLALAVLATGAGCKNLFDPRAKGSGALAWATPTRSLFHGMPAVDGERVYVEGDSGLAAFHQTTGRRVWEPRQRLGGSSANIVYADRRLYSAEVEVVRAYDAATGAVAWSRSFPSESSPDFAVSALDGSAMYVGTRDHRVLALNRVSGAPLWDVDTGRGWEFPGPVRGLSTSGDTVYATLSRELNPNGFNQAAVIVALDRSSGRELWRYQSAGTKSSVIGPAVVAGRLLVASDLYGNSFFAVDRFTGREVWRTPGQPGYGGPYATPVVVGDVVYAGMVDTHVYAADLATGRVRWRSVGTGASIRAIGVCGDRVIVNNDDIVVMSRGNGRLLSTPLRSTDDEFATSGVAVANGRAFIAGSRKVYAVDCR
ncbi:MAG TPA: PQQ-binding-like beta-propeller repeat protein [Longimicrobium sp.]|nr:PQQ-binding-like beta-propeller repeat protein [Longimicrobium sp.]